MVKSDYIINFENIRRGHVGVVGGKNASLGEMVANLKSKNIAVPNGFATTAKAYWYFIDHNNLRSKIETKLASLKVDQSNLAEIGQYIRGKIKNGSFPVDLATEITTAYQELIAHKKNISVAVRSSATAEDLPNASFAGQQESFLNISGEEELLEYCRRCFASLFTNRAIIYRNNNNFAHMQVALSIGIQEMVRSDIGASGVMFSVDTETGFPNVVLINASWGLGESIVQGTVNPDEYMAFKPFLGNKELSPVIKKTLGEKESKVIYGGNSAQPTQTVKTSVKEQNTYVLENTEILQLARWANIIEAYYQTPMDIEWAKDGKSGELYIVQARPETIQSRKTTHNLKSYSLIKKGKCLLEGHSIGAAIATGKVYNLKSPKDIDHFPEGAILVTGATDPDWVPIMKKATAIITDHGGRTSHAAIVSREMGLPAIVGCSNASKLLKTGQEVTVSCAEGDKGYVYNGIGKFEVEDIAISDIPKTNTKIMLNLADPATAQRWWQLPTDGVGLLRMEFIINNTIKAHPLALLNGAKIGDKATIKAIATLTRAYTNKETYFVDTLAQGIAQIAAVHYPKPVILRMSDFKTNEYANLIGGTDFEPKEENPMLGWRGASRYYSPEYKEGFALECKAVKKVREEMGFKNVITMIPFCRTLDEADKVLAEMKNNGLERGKDGFEVYVMCEVPANIILADKFADRFDGFSIGSNDLTQLTLGVDRDSDRLAMLFSEDNEAVIASINHVIKAAHKKGRKIGLCGQAPSDRPEFAQTLVKAGIDSISVTPDSFIKVKNHVAEVEGR